MDYVFLILLVVLIFGPDDIFQSEFLSQPAIIMGDLKVTYFGLIIIALAVSWLLDIYHLE